MEVILLERVSKLGQMGDTVRVKDGYARNFLLPNNKALRATKANKERFESERVQLEARNLEQRKEAEAVAVKLDGQTFTLIRQAGETGHLYGSVASRDIAEAINETGKGSVQRNQVTANVALKTLGLFPVTVSLHPEVKVEITVNIARIGDRPGGETAAEHPLVRAAQAITLLSGREPELAVASTDANVPIGLGIPAIAIGAGGRGGDAHSATEWFENANGTRGVGRALAIVLTAANARDG